MGLFLRALTAFLILPGTVAFLVPWSLHPGGAHIHAAGVPLLCGGTLLLLWCVRDFYVTGRGSLALWAFASRTLWLYASTVALGFHLRVARRSFG